MVDAVILASPIMGHMPIGWITIVPLYQSVYEHGHHFSARTAAVYVLHRAKLCKHAKRMVRGDTRPLKTLAEALSRGREWRRDFLKHAILAF